MKNHIVKVLNIKELTHDVRQITLQRPNGYEFISGQATEVSINKPQWKDEKRPFTFTSLNESPNLEFVIKIYPEHKGVTAELGKLTTGDELIIRDVWGTITYNGPGVFIAAGAGITPFISIIKQLQKNGKIKDHQLLFSNKTQNDIILNETFRTMLGDSFINVLTRENKTGLHFGRIDKNYLQETIKNFNQHFYICGPDGFVTAIKESLLRLNAHSESLVVEK